MNWGLFACIALVLGIISFLTWVYIRRDIQELSAIPALKRLKKWQLVVGYLIVWAIVSFLIERTF